MPEEVSDEFLGKAIEQSAVLSQFRRVPVGRAQVRFPILSALPVAYWVGGDTGLKQTTEVNWTNKFLNIEEIATIMPVPDAVAADVEMNIWDSSMPYLAEAVGAHPRLGGVLRCERAVVASRRTSRPRSPRRGTTTRRARGGGRRDFGDIDSMYHRSSRPTASTSTAMSRRGRCVASCTASRSTQGERLDQGRVSRNLSELDGDPIAYPMRGLWPSGGGSHQRAAVRGRLLAVRGRCPAGRLGDPLAGGRHPGQHRRDRLQRLPAGPDVLASHLPHRLAGQQPINYDQPTEASRYPVASLIIPNPTIPRAGREIPHARQLPFTTSWCGTHPGGHRRQLTTDTQSVDQAPFDCTVSSVQYVPAATITGANTNYRSVTLFNKGQAGAGTTTVATLQFDSGVNATADDEKTITLSGTPANLTVAAGDTLLWRSLHVGTGITDPGGLVRITITRTYA
jgi:hypothetical protein